MRKKSKIKHFYASSHRNKRTLQRRHIFRIVTLARISTSANQIKTEPTEKIRQIMVGNVDLHGNRVSHVHASGNDYVIYEIEHSDIGNRLRVLIDGRNDAEEQFLKEKFASVKMLYTEAKGLLYRSPNFGMMKNRIAHALASHFTLPDRDGARVAFQELVHEIKKEHELSIFNRAAYVLPSMLSVIALFYVASTLTELRSENPAQWQVIVASLASALGGSMSILLKMKDVNFEEYRRMHFYLLAGLERIFLAAVAGAIAFVLMKSRLLLPNLLKSDYWGIMAVVAAAGFSEALVPRYIGNADRAQ